MATSIATGALKPKVAVILSACLNFAGAFISISVAATIAKGIVNPEVLAGGDGLELVLAALIGAASPKGQPRISIRGSEQMVASRSSDR
jgi:inorganic phosphate transporter, PiT family